MEIFDFLQIEFFLYNLSKVNIRLQRQRQVIRELAEDSLGSLEGGRDAAR